jgi:hypothetical protein
MESHTCKCTTCGRTMARRRRMALVSQRYNEEDIRLTDLLHSLVAENFPFVAAKPFGEKDYEDIHRLATTYPYKVVEAVIYWCQQDDFWKQNIRSTAKLRKQFDSLLVRAKADQDVTQRKAAVL